MSEKTSDKAQTENGETGFTGFSKFLILIAILGLFIGSMVSLIASKRTRTETASGHPIVGTSATCVEPNAMAPSLVAKVDAYVGPGPFVVKAGEWSKWTPILGKYYWVKDQAGQTLRTGIAFEYMNSHGSVRASRVGGDTNDDTRYMRYRIDQDTTVVIENM